MSEPITLELAANDLVDALEALTVALELDDYRGWNELVPFLKVVRIAKMILAQCDKDIVARIANQRPPMHSTIDGIGEVEVRYHTKRSKWDMDKLLPAVVGRVIDEPATLFDPETGELLPVAVIANNVAARLRGAIGMYVGKVTGLAALGIQADEFCHEEPGEIQVTLPKPEIA